MSTKNKNYKTISDSFENSFIVTAIRLEALSERYLFKPAGISSASFKMLAFIKNNNGCSPSSILDYRGGTKSNITQRLNLLERQGLIFSSRPQEGDRRKVILQLTPAGARKLGEVLDNIKKSRIHMEKFFTKKELQSHLKFMSKLDESLNKCEDIMKCNCVKNKNK
jgi:DNA-binding MarR family transcriptional regulator